MAEEVEYRCFIGGLSWSTSDRGLKDAFEKFGHLIEAKVPDLFFSCLLFCCPFLAVNSFSCNTVLHFFFFNFGYILLAILSSYLVLSFSIPT